MLRRLTRFLCLCAFAGLSLSSVKAQKVVLKINPLSLFLATLNFQAEMAVSDKWSVQLGTFYGGAKLRIGNSDLAEEIGYTWFALTPEARYYAQNQTKETPRGLFMGPFLRYRLDRRQFASNIYDPDEQAFSTGVVNKQNHLFGGGVVLGYQWLFNDVFALDLYGGPQYLAGPSNYEFDCLNCDGDESTVEEPIGLNFTGVSIRLGASLGVAF